MRMMIKSGLIFPSDLMVPMCTLVSYCTRMFTYLHACLDRSLSPVVCCMGCCPYTEDQFNVLDTETITRGLK